MEKKKEEGSIWFLIIFGGGVALLIYFQAYKKDTSYYLGKAFEANIEQSYQGVIKEKYIERMNHNSLMIKFTNEGTIGINGYFLGRMKVGDSISKVKGDSIIQVFRNGEKIILEIAPFYEKAIKEQKENN